MTITRAPLRDQIYLEVLARIHRGDLPPDHESGIRHWRNSLASAGLPFAKPSSGSPGRGCWTSRPGAVSASAPRPTGTAQCRGDPGQPGAPGPPARSRLHARQAGRAYRPRPADRADPGRHLQGRGPGRRLASAAAGERPEPAPARPHLDPAPGAPALPPRLSPGSGTFEPFQPPSQPYPGGVAAAGTGRPPRPARAPLAPRHRGDGGLDQVTRPITTSQVAAWRSDTPGCDVRAHLNNAGAALVPRPVIEAVTHHLELEQTLGGYEAAEARREGVDEAARLVARLLGAPPGTIAMSQNSTTAFAQALEAFDFRPATGSSPAAPTMPRTRSCICRWRGDAVSRSSARPTCPAVASTPTRPAHCSPASPHAGRPHVGAHQLRTGPGRGGHRSRVR